MEFLGQNYANDTSIYRLRNREAKAIARLMHALTKTPLDGIPSEAAYQEMVTQAVEMIEQLATLLERGPVKLFFEPAHIDIASPAEVEP